MRHRLLIGALAALATLTSAVRAEPRGSAGDPEATISAELVVRARLPGPAWWTISKGDSKIYIIGIPGSLPKGMAWDTSVLARRLAGANELVGRPTVTAGVGDFIGLMRLRSKTPMEDTLSPALRARLAATEARENLDGARYSHWPALIAGLALVSDYRGKQKLSIAEPGASIERLARQAGVKVRPAATYSLGTLLKSAEPHLNTVGEVCITDALDEIDAGPGAVHAAATGWAAGDPRAALAGGRGYEKCVNALPEGADLARRAMDDTANTLFAALAKPGHSVAIVNLRTLLASRGVLNQLRARGVKVTTPEDE